MFKICKQDKRGIQRISEPMFHRVVADTEDMIDKCYNVVDGETAS
jgi:hypothetical protein